MPDINSILTVLLIGGSLSWLRHRHKLPVVVALVLLGVVVANAVIGWVEYGPALHRLGQIGVVLLLGMASFTLAVKRFNAAGRARLSVAMMPFAKRRITTLKASTQRVGH